MAGGNYFFFFFFFFFFDSIQRNGYYTGIPTLMAGGNYQYGYEYIHPGWHVYHIRPHDQRWSDGSNRCICRGYSSDHSGYWTIFTIPAETNGQAGSADFSFVVKPKVDLSEFTFYGGYDDTWLTEMSYGGSIVDIPDTTMHTINRGPMSNAVAIFSNGKLTYNGLQQYTVA